MEGIILSHIGNALYGRLEGHKPTCIGSIGASNWRIMGIWQGQDFAREIVRRWNIAGSVESVIGRIGDAD